MVYALLRFIIILNHLYATRRRLTNHCFTALIVPLLQVHAEQGLSGEAGVTRDAEEPARCDAMLLLVLHQVEATLRAEGTHRALVLLHISMYAVRVTVQILLGTEHLVAQLAAILAPRVVGVVVELVATRMRDVLELLAA